jgi:predicted RNA-binding Zn-ribbon protein involved in translation (DUF1610 family)
MSGTDYKWVCSKCGWTGSDAVIEQGEFPEFDIKCPVCGDVVYEFGHKREVTE